MNFSQIEDAEKRKECIGVLKERWTQLNDLNKDRFEKVIQYLILTNSGGAVAVLTYIGGNSGHSPKGVIFALIAFAMGLILAGILIAMEFHFVENLLHGWNSDGMKFLNNNMNWQNLLEEDEKKIRCPLV